MFQINQMESDPDIQHIMFLVWLTALQLPFGGSVSEWELVETKHRANRE